MIDGRVGTSVPQEAILLTDRDRIPDLERWDPPVPLVLLEGMYRPYTNRLPPISGIDGDVRDLRSIIRLRNAHPTTTSDAWRALK